MSMYHYDGYEYYKWLSRIGMMECAKYFNAFGVKLLWKRQ